MKSKYLFYWTLGYELLLLPVLYLAHWVKVLFGGKNRPYKLRQAVASPTVRVVVHEWGGYDLLREKTIKNGATFSCGLGPQLDRFAGRQGVELTVTISDTDRHKNLDYVRSRAAVVEVDNVGMDFSGYAALYERIKELPNSYVVLTNSSVNALQEEFLDGYIDYMERNPQVGMLGVSYCTKVVQTLVRKNFTPHLQSFFLLTTTDVLRQVVEKNHGQFPGEGIDHKLWLIRRGEIRLSRLVQQLGYALAVVDLRNGKPYRFDRYKHWKLPKGDIRQQIDTPNRITPISCL